MRHQHRLKKIFNTVAAAVMAVNVFGAPVQSEARSLPVTAAVSTGSAGCPGFPDFKKPLHRMTRGLPREKDPALKAQQYLLRDAGLMTARHPDGTMGPTTRHAMRLFQILYGPLYGKNTVTDRLDARDVAQLRQSVAQIKADARRARTEESTVAALRLASLRTGVPYTTLLNMATKNSSAALFEVESARWLYLVKTMGAQYGLGFYADKISLRENAAGEIVPVIDNPFIHRQILGLRDNKNLSALMAAENIRGQDQVPLLQTAEEASFSADLHQQQRALMMLGFNIGDTQDDGQRGIFTDIALKEFQILYGHTRPHSVPSGQLSDAERKILFDAAERADLEHRAFRAPTLAVGAIRMACEKRGSEFGFMMELAATESSFIHDIKAKTTSATGLWQFIEDTWLEEVSRHGEKYGLGDFVPFIELYTDENGRSRARVDDPFMRLALLQLRKDPHLSTLLSVELQLENSAKLECYVDGGPLSRPDLYLAHFLGAHDAVIFINTQRRAPGQSAPDVFPEAARYNANVFYTPRRGERSLQQVYDFFARKFDTRIYDGKPVQPPSGTVLSDVKKFRRLSGKV